MRVLAASRKARARSLYVRCGSREISPVCGFHWELGISWAVGDGDIGGAHDAVSDRESGLHHLRHLPLLSPLFANRGNLVNIGGEARQRRYHHRAEHQTDTNYSH